MNKKYISIIATIILFGCIYIFGNKFFNSQSVIEIEAQDLELESLELKNLETQNLETININEEIKVYICGAVNNSEVFTVNQGSRIIDVLELAGGATADADLDQINLADFVQDAQKIYIPKIGEKVDKIDFTAQNSSVQNDLININTADIVQLQSLPGIGQTIAQYIIDYRNQNGNFKNIDEIRNVAKIGDKTFEKIKDRITVN